LIEVKSKIEIFEKEKNYPLLQDFIQPYMKNISFYYVLFVVSNIEPVKKAEEQIKLINNTMPFISKVTTTTTNDCLKKNN